MSEDNKQELSEQELTAGQLEEVAGGAETVHLYLKTNSSNLEPGRLEFPNITLKKTDTP